MQKDNYMDDEFEIDLVLLMKELFAHWILIVISTILVGGIFFTISKFFITPQYKATAKIYVLNTENASTSLADVQIASNLLKDYQEIAKSPVILLNVIDELKLEESYEQLLSKLTVSNPSDRIMSLTITDPNVDRAKMIVDEISDVVIAHVEGMMNQKVLTILEYGYANPKKVSPNNTSNALWGAIIGCFIAVFTITVSFILNDKINSTEDIEKRLGLNVLGLVPYEDSWDYTGDSMTKKKKRKKKK